MAKPKRSRGQQSKKSWQKIWSACFLSIGAILLFAVALSLVKINLSSHQSSRQHYLTSSQEFMLTLPLPQIAADVPTKEPEPVVQIQPTPEPVQIPTLDISAEPTPLSTPEVALEVSSEPTQAALLEVTPDPSSLAVLEPAPGPEKTAQFEPVPALMPDQDLETSQVPILVTPTLSLPALTPNALVVPDHPWNFELPGPTIVYIPIVNRTIPGTSGQEPADNSNTENPVGKPPIGAVPGPSAGSVVRLVVPSLKIDRAVVTVGLKTGPDKQTTWNTDVLFSTANRSDLVGQAITSANPGEGGNIILIGHNYNNGWSANGAVFVNLQSLKIGSEITLFTESGKEFRYIVQLVKKVPWKEQDDNELQKHHKYMWPTDHEQLTLVTCGGINIGAWSARIYAIATPAESQE